MSEPLYTLLLALADDELTMGHRATEWTGLGPILEADLALSSISQDEIGHAELFYQLLHERGGPTPDELVFQRQSPGAWHNAIFCELQRRDWGDTVVRHFLYDLAEQVRLAALSDSSDGDLAAIARKIRPEEKYHMLHGRTWMARLARGTGESHHRLQRALDRLLPYAFGLWEPLPDEKVLVAEGVMPPSETLRDQWWRAVTEALDQTFTLPALDEIEPVTGGRRGEHSEDMTQLLDAMQHLHRALPGTTW